MSPARVGPISQRELLPLLVRLIDDSMAPNSTAHRDIARTRLRETLATTNWKTTYIFNNLSPRRCKYLAQKGYPIPSRWLLTTWKVRPGEDKPDAGE